MRYYAIKSKFRNAYDRKRVIKGLRDLRELMAKEVPSKDSEHNLLLATWNLRDFGKPTRLRKGYGARLPETLWYIAQVISQFDIVAVQEVNELAEWEDVMYILGPDWDFIATDVTDRSLGGNGERLTYVFDKRKVGFRNIAGEIVLPINMLINKVELKRVQEQVEEGAAPPPANRSAEKKEETFYAGKQFRRSPFVVSFQSGWLRFDICTVHIFYGDDSGEKLNERIEEIAAVAKYFGTRGEDAIKSGKALILLGDFNIVHPEHKTMEALDANGFEVPGHALHKSNVNNDKYYDQIAFKANPGVVKYSESASQKNAGVIDFFSAVFREDQVKDYKPFFKDASAKKSTADAKFYADWKTYQMSDHKPLWVRLKTDGSDAYLEGLLGAE